MRLLGSCSAGMQVRGKAALKVYQQLVACGLTYAARLMLLAAVLGLKGRSAVQRSEGATGVTAVSPAVVATGATVVLYQYWPARPGMKYCCAAAEASE